MFPKKDLYLKKRGGIYKIYKIYCENCKTFLFNYQKDGKGILKRIYFDRIDKIEKTFYEGRCYHCGINFGIPYIYAKEKRPAIRLFVGALIKKIIK